MLSVQGDSKLRAVLWAMGYNERASEPGSNIAFMVPCPLGTFSNITSKGTEGCTACPPGNVHQFSIASHFIYGTCTCTVCVPNLLNREVTLPSWCHAQWGHFPTLPPKELMDVQHVLQVTYINFPLQVILDTALVQ